MSLSLGSTTIGGMYVGSTKIGEAYLGSTLVYTSSGPTPGNTVTIGGKVYPYVRMPDGRDWLQYNLDLQALGITVSSSLPNLSDDTPTCTYYQYNETTYGWNGAKWGLLYNLVAINFLQSSRSTLFNGWHVPTRNEWLTLQSSVNDVAEAIKDSTWDGNGTTDFDALPCGRAYARGFGSTTSVTWYNNTAYFGWVGPYGESVGQGVVTLTNGTSTALDISTNITSNSGRRNRYYSVRLIKDV